MSDSNSCDNCCALLGCLCCCCCVIDDDNRRRPDNNRASPAYAQPVVVSATAYVPPPNPAVFTKETATAVPVGPYSDSTCPPAYPAVPAPAGYYQEPPTATVCTVQPKV